MPIPLMIIGLILAIGSLAGAYWLASFTCGMNPTGCDIDGLTLFIDLITSKEGLLFLAPAAAGLVFFLMGLRARSS